jgi:hypothetical protein
MTARPRTKTLARAACRIVADGSAADRHAGRITSGPALQTEGELMRLIQAMLVATKAHPELRLRSDAAMPMVSHPPM